MWERLTSPDILIFLDVSFEESMKRRKQNWTLADYQDSITVSAMLVSHANLYLDTTSLTPEDVLEKVLQCINASASSPSPASLPIEWITSAVIVHQTSELKQILSFQQEIIPVYDLNLS